MSLLSLLVILLISTALCQPEQGFKELSNDSLSNLRSSLVSDDHLLGLIEGLMLMRHDDDSIRVNVRTCLVNMYPSDERINMLISRARNCALFGASRLPLVTPHYPPNEAGVQLMQERVNIASQFLQEYQRDISIRDRLIAVDEMWVSQSNLLLIAATFRDRIIAYRFVENRGMRTEDYRQFIEEDLTNAINDNNIINPIMIVDNLRTHLTSDARNSLDRLGIRVWLNPRYSQDMMPLDIDAFECVRVRLREECFKDLEELKESVRLAIEEVNDSGCIESMSNLPLIWGEVIAGGGVSRRPRIVTTTLTYNTDQYMRKRRDVSLYINSMHKRITKNCERDTDQIYTNATCKDFKSKSTVRGINTRCLFGFCWSSCREHVYNIDQQAYQLIASSNICPTSRDDPTLETCKTAADCNPCWTCARKCRNPADFEINFEEVNHRV